MKINWLYVCILIQVFLVVSVAIWTYATGDLFVCFTLGWYSCVLFVLLLILYRDIKGEEV